MKKGLILISILILITFSALLFNPFRAISSDSKQEIVMIDSESPDAAAISLEDEKMIRSFSAFNLAYKIIGKNKIEPGGYYISKNMNTFKIINELNNGPDLKSIIIVEGLRKEQIGERLQKTLGWSDTQLEEWNNAYSKNNTDYKEGVYFPDTYLIPVKETPMQVANRMIGNFNSKFTQFFKESSEQNIKWTTVLKMASIIQREAGGSSDMPLIAGIMWNRLNSNHALQLDATIQYAKGKTNGQWWSTVTGSDIKNIDSPYNSYQYKGLPPTPISNPGISAIKAVLNPTETDCFYYLHDHSRQIHCTKTYEEHLENIDKYLN